ncbi:uncharacterized protein LOC142982370 [Anticarsia gemmatalis]|uniref:uncharacterized protein LOC142982370 n=1 Tax=Anticarsia gemmatalis TaxID=129554 RepID=UPI003F760753
MTISIVIFILICVCRQTTGQWCGRDRSNSSVIQAGNARIDTYPWMGFLIYPYGNDAHEEEPKTTTVVLIAANLVLAMALEVEKIPKLDFRLRSRVVLGLDCGGPYLRVKEYIFHPEFGEKYLSALAIVQIQTSPMQAYMPICSPPPEFEAPDIFAMTMTYEYEKPMIKIHKMKFMTLNDCKYFYKKNDLDVLSLWPKHSSCARSVQKSHCIWESGTMLVTKQYGTWSLLGVGVYGPGCGSPARFLEYDPYDKWVRQTMDSIGKVSVTRLSSSHLVVRRSSLNIQRYGDCDPEEVQAEIFSDRTEVEPPKSSSTQYTKEYNLTLYAKIEYSCVVLRVFPTDDISYNTTELRIKRWCKAEVPSCTSDSYVRIHFLVQIDFDTEVVYRVSAYGRELQYAEVKKLVAYKNSIKNRNSSIMMQGEHRTISYITPRWTTTAKEAMTVELSQTQETQTTLELEETKDPLATVEPAEIQDVAEDSTAMGEPTNEQETAKTLEPVEIQDLDEIQDSTTTEEPTLLEEFEDIQEPTTSLEPTEMQEPLAEEPAEMEEAEKIQKPSATAEPVEIQEPTAIQKPTTTVEPVEIQKPSAEKLTAVEDTNDIQALIAIEKPIEIQEPAAIEKPVKLLEPQTKAQEVMQEPTKIPESDGRQYHFYQTDFTITPYVKVLW